MGFNRKEEGQCFVAIQGKIKICFCSQKPKIHFGGVLVEKAVVTEIIWHYVYTDPYLIICQVQGRSTSRGPQLTGHLFPHLTSTHDCMGRDLTNIPGTCKPKSKLQQHTPETTAPCPQVYISLRKRHTKSVEVDPGPIHTRLWVPRMWSTSERWF